MIDPPVFTTPNASTAEETLKAEYESITGKTLYPAQPETLLANWAAYLKTVVDTAIQYTGEQELVNFATGSNLDQIGALFGSDGDRLPAEAAQTTLQFTLTSILGVNKVIPAGTRARSQDNLFLFATDSALTITAGNLTGTVPATCTVTGTGGNGYAAGQINILFDLISGVASVSNTTTSNSGAAIESDENYRERLKLAPNSLAVGGSRDSYIFYARSADSSITDVAVRSPDPDDIQTLRTEYALQLAQEIIDDIDANHGGTTAVAADINEVIEPYLSQRYFYVEVYILTNLGAASPEVLTKVSQKLNGDLVRPLNDQVIVRNAIQISYVISAEITIFADATSQISTDLNTAAQTYADAVAAKIGKDVVRSQIIDALSIEGVYSVVLNSPAADILIDWNERGVNSNITINIVGTTEG